MPSVGFADTTTSIDGTASAPTGGRTTPLRSGMKGGRAAEASARRKGWLSSASSLLSWSRKSKGDATATGSTSSNGDGGIHRGRRDSMESVSSSGSEAEPQEALPGPPRRQQGSWYSSYLPSLSWGTSQEVAEITGLRGVDGRVYPDYPSSTLASGPPVRRPSTSQRAAPVTITTDGTLDTSGPQRSWGDYARNLWSSSRPAVENPKYPDGTDYVQNNGERSAATPSGSWFPSRMSLGGKPGAASSARPDSGIVYETRPLTNTASYIPQGVTPIGTAPTSYIPAGATSFGTAPGTSYIPMGVTPVYTAAGTSYNPMSQSLAPCGHHAGCPCFQETMYSMSASRDLRPHHVVPGSQYSSAHHAGQSSATDHRRSQWTHLRSAMPISDISSARILGGQQSTWDGRGRRRRLEFARRDDGTVSRTATIWGSNGSVGVSSINYR